MLNHKKRRLIQKKKEKVKKLEIVLDNKQQTLNQNLI